MSNFNKAIKCIGKSFKQVWFDFVESFKIRPWKVCTILFMVPGLFIGLFLGSHYTATIPLPQEFGMVGFWLFLVILLGCINIFNAFSFSAKRSLFMAIFSTVVSVLLAIAAIMYIKVFFTAPNYRFSTDSYISIAVVSFGTLCSVVASILTYFFIDHDRVKD